MINTAVNIKAGLLSYEPGWEIVLEQIGMAWEVITSPAAIILENYSVVIINSPVNDEFKKVIEKYFSEGGAAVLVYVNGSSLLNSSVKKRNIGSMLPSMGEFSTYDLLDIHDTAAFSDDSVVNIVKKGAGLFAHVPFNINKIITSVDSQRKNFYAHRERLPDEIVRLRSNFTLRRLINSVLEYLHHSRGIPFIHKWYFPGDTATIFTFRIDSDKGTQEEIEGLYQLSEKYKIPTSWFLDVKSHELWLDYFEKFKSQETGIHCYEHATYNSVEENFENFSKALSALKKHGVNIKGLAAPQGKWNYSLNAALEKLGVNYSSEFGFDYDNFPSYPWTGNSFSKVLQLPVHPVCPGTMRRQRFSGNEMIQYFISYIDKQISLREPIALYHHPGHHYNDVFEKVFRYINERNLLKLSYAAYTDWWRKRISVKPNLLWQPGNKSIMNKSAGPEEVRFRISMPQNKEVIAPLAGETMVDSLNLKEYKINITPPADLMRTRKFDWRHIVHSTLDYWYSVKK